MRQSRDIRQGLGLVSSAGRACRELAATGEASPARLTDRIATLTLPTQELVIARLAAQGMSNRDDALRHAEQS